MVGWSNPLCAHSIKPGHHPFRGDLSAHEIAIGLAHFQHPAITGFGDDRVSARCLFEASGDPLAAGAHRSA